MKLRILLTPAALGADRLQALLEARREVLAGRRILFPTSPGKRNHARLFMALTDPDHVDPLRAARGHAAPEQQGHLRELVRQELAREIDMARPDMVILTASQFLTTLNRPTEIRRFRDFVAPWAEDVELILHLDDPARVLVRHHAEQVMLGRTAGPELELGLKAAPDWRQAALDHWRPSDPRLNAYPEIQAPPPWLDYAATIAAWEAAFGAGTLRVRPYAADAFHGRAADAELAATFGIAPTGPADPAAPELPPSDESLARARAVNALFEQLLATGRAIPRPLWRKLLAEVELPGPPMAAGALAPISARFAEGCRALVAREPALATALTPDPPLPDWHEPAFSNGFRARQYVAAFLPRIEKATADLIAAAAKRSAKTRNRVRPVLSPEAERILPPLAKAQFATLAGSRFAPHNDLGHVREDQPGVPYEPRAPHRLAEGRTGNIIVGCMKNEGPYILEWVAYHRCIGVDNFLIYTNGCEDGTDEILDRMQEMGLVQHRNNDDWKGNSPQQSALNKSLKEGLVRHSDWIIHIDVDEFMNIRCGNGTLDDLFAAVPDATTFAMTWRLFGHDAVTAYEDKPVIAQFTRCAPAYCPKPHTVWGFKSMFRNDGAYAKFSCHRPNKLAQGRQDGVKWVNGSGEPMEATLKEKGWRNGIGDIGYDLIQLNHYALRSADSFLIKRQRGRALHVDRSIGLNYWIRMDWSDAVDVTIQRNLPRLGDEMARLLQDAELAQLHRRAVDWHRAKAAELHATPEFQELYNQALATQLSGMERVAYALALDMES